MTQLDFTEAESDAMANDLELNDLAESFKASARGLMHRCFRFPRHSAPPANASIWQLTAPVDSHVSFLDVSGFLLSNSNVSRSVCSPCHLRETCM